mgnify:CR=1 FL=1
MSGKVPETAPTPEIPNSFKYTPLEQLRAVFVGFVQGLFNSAPNGCYHWEPDENDTEIVIQDEGVLRSETVAKRPGVSIVRGPLQFSTLSLDDMEKYDMDIGRKTKSVIVSGTMVINCVSRVSLESEKIAWIVAEHIWLLRDYLLRAGLFDTGRGAQLGAPSPAGSIVADDKGDEFVVTPVAMPLQFVRRSSFMPLNQNIVNNIIYRISTNIPGSISAGQGAALSTHEQPVGVYACPPGSFYPGASDAYGKTPRAGAEPQRLVKVPHPLNPAREVFVRQVRPSGPGVRGFLNLDGSSVPIPNPCVKES